MLSLMKFPGIRKYPSISVVVPVVVWILDFTLTVAPIIGSRVSASKTFPSTAYMYRAYAIPENRIKIVANANRIFLFINAYFRIILQM